MSECKATTCCLNTDGHCADEMSNSSPNICKWGAKTWWTLPDYWEFKAEQERRLREKK